MNIPLEPRKPIEGIAPKAPQSEQRHYIARVLSPFRFWRVVKVAATLNRSKGVSGLAVGQFLVPKGYPGSGILRGAQNISKTLTYRSNAAEYTRLMDEERTLRNNRRQRASEWSNLVKSDAVEQL